MSCTVFIRIKDSVGRFLTLNNRLIFYSSLQILFTIFIVIIFSQYLFRQFKAILIQNEVQLYQQIIENKYQDNFHLLTRKLQAALISLPNRNADTIPPEKLQSILNSTGSEFIFILDKQGQRLSGLTLPGGKVQSPRQITSLNKMLAVAGQGNRVYSTEKLLIQVQDTHSSPPKPAPLPVTLSLATHANPAKLPNTNASRLYQMVVQPVKTAHGDVKQIILTGIYLNEQTDFIATLNHQQKNLPNKAELEAAETSLEKAFALVPFSNSMTRILKNTTIHEISSTGSPFFPILTLYNIDHQPVGAIRLNAKLTPSHLQIEQLWHWLLVVRLISLVIGIMLAILMTKSLLRPIITLANKSQSILDGNLNVPIEEVPQKDEMSILNNTISRMVKQLLHNNAKLEDLVNERTQELQKINETLTEKENALIKQNEELLAKEELLTVRNEALGAKEAKLTEYITRLSEQQEWDRVVKWMVTSIRESLELDEVIRRTTQEIGQLLNVDECFITAYHPKQALFSILHVFKADTTKEEPVPLTSICDQVKQQICDQKQPIIINNIHLFSKEPLFEEKLESLPLKSLIILPLVHNQELLGTLTVHQNSFYRIWSEREIEFLKDIAQQVSIAIRQAKLYAAAQEATRLKSEFLANMSHELRTPLNAILGFSEMIQSKTYGPLTAKQEDYVQNVIISGRHLLTLVNDVLDLSKVESGNMELHYELFELKSIIQEAISIIRVIAHKKQILINLAIESNVRFAYADIARFKQILYNLLSNAIKFTKEGGSISLGAYLDKDDPNTFYIDVADTGIGIAEEDRHIVFSEFQQIDASYARVQEGSGLGLALTKTLVEMHNGTIDFVSRLGVGSVFTFSLPCHISCDIPAKQTSNSLSTYHQELVRSIAKAPQALELLQEHAMQYTELVPLVLPDSPLSPLSEKRPNLLVIAASPERFQQLRDSFQPGAYHLHAALSETEIYRYYLEHELPDLIIMDMQLFENAHGSHIVHSLKSRSNWSAIPLIFATTEEKPGSDERERPNVRSLGAIDYLYTSSSEQILLNHLEKIRYNIVKEDFIHVLILGSSYTASRLTENHWPEWNCQSNHFKIIHIPYPNEATPLLCDQEVLQQALGKSPDIILIEMSHFLETSMLVLLEHLKSRIETKYIPIILIQSVHSDAIHPHYTTTPSTLQIVSTSRRSNDMTLQRPESIEFWNQPLPFRCRGNLIKDVEYALRIKRQRGELYRECI